MPPEPEFPNRLLKEQFERELSTIEEFQGYTWEDLDVSEQRLAVVAAAASRKWFGGSQCFVVKHNGTKKGNSTTCSGDVYAFIDNNGDVTYKCQSCGRNWTNTNL